MFSVSFSDVTTTHTAGKSHPTASATISVVRIQYQRRPNVPIKAAQYWVWPRSSRNCTSEKARITRNSTHAIAVAEPKWKKFWNAVS